MSPIWSDVIDTGSRRRFLRRAALMGAWSAVATLTIDALSIRAYAATQDNWRSCDKCHMIFYNGYRKSICPAGNRHQASMIANYLLPYDVPATPQAQGAWRFCNKCESLFFDGYTPKGVCPAGQGHVAQGLVFVLRHDVNDRFADKNWRYCTKCHALFYDHSGKDKGKCPAGGGHVEAGFNFVIEYQTSSF